MAIRDSTSQVDLFAAFGNAQPANPFLFRDGQFVTGANLSWNKSKHSFRGGIEWNHALINHFQPQGGTFQQARGAFQFNGNVTSQQGSTPAYQNQWADYLFGLPNATGKSRPLSNPNTLRWSQWAFYLQDHFQVSPNLTLAVGVRWEYYPFGYADNGKGLRYLDLKTGNILIGGFGNVPRNDGIDTGSGRFLPRVGLNYRIKNSTVLRAGYGQSADPNNWRYFRNAYPAVVIDNNIPGSSADFIPVASLTGLNGAGLGGGSYTVPTGVVLQPLPDLSSGSIPIPTSVNTTTIQNPFRRGYINSFNLTAQQEWKGYVLDVGYVGTMAVRPLTNMNVNPSLPGTGSAGGLLSQALGKNFTSTINALVPFKNNYYNSLQSKVTHRFSEGSSFGVGWTWSRATDFSDNEDLSSLSFPHPSFVQKNYGPAGFDRTHNIEIYGVFAAPFGKGHRWLQDGVAGQILGGWLINPIISKMSGVPFTVSAGGSLNANGSGQTADLVGTYRLTHGRPPRTGKTCAHDDLSCHYFDPTAFAAPVITSNANAHYGNTNRNEFRGPGYFNMNLSLLREFSIKEKVKLTIRADAFSLTNTPHFANPGASCPASAVIPNSQVCSLGPVPTTPSSGDTGFGVVTGAAQPGGFFGPDPGNRTIWLGANVKDSSMRSMTCPDDGQKPLPMCDSAALSFVAVVYKGGAGRIAPFRFLVATLNTSGDIPCAFGSASYCFPLSFCSQPPSIAARRLLDLRRPERRPSKSADRGLSIPHLEKRGSATQLIVDGNPFLVLGGELHNSSSSSLAYMEPVWPRLTAMHLNTAVLPIAWETIEPQEGKFDYTVLDGLLKGARQNNLRLVLLWFGAWKNTYSSYVPAWVKTDTDRFPRVQTSDGRDTERLSPFSGTVREADAKAFANLMQHLRAVDGEKHTVLMMQVENEVGVIPQSRDHSAVANASFGALVPAALMSFLEAHRATLNPEFRAAWEDAGGKTAGTWQEVFGKSPLTDDLFMAWQYATYIEAITAAGKAQYSLPMYANAALIRPNYEPGQYNSGGPLPHSADVWHAGAPSLDFLSPDIYFNDFVNWAGQYTHADNPLFIPEAQGGAAGAANVLYAVGGLSAIGFSAFGIDDQGNAPLDLVGITSPTEHPDNGALGSAYGVLTELTPLILERQQKGEVSAALIEGEAQRSARLSIGDYTANITRAGGGPGAGAGSRVGAMFLQTGPNEFWVVGSGDAQITFSTDKPGLPLVGIESIDEEFARNGKWEARRRLNGDENSQGQALKLYPGDLAQGRIYRVRLYRYR